MKRYFHIVCVLFIALALGSVAHGQGSQSQSPRIKIVSATGTVDIDVQLMSIPEQWAVAPQALMSLGTNGPEGVLVKYPFARHVGFVANRSVPMDVLFVTEDGQVRGFFENVTDSEYHGFDKPVIAVIFVHGGVVKKNSIQRGNLVVSQGFSLAPTVNSSLAVQDDFRSGVEKKMKRSAEKSVRVSAELGAFYLEQRAYQKAQAVYRKWLSIDPNNTVSQIGLAMALSGMGEVDKAIEKLGEVISRDGTNEDAYFHLARIFRHVKKVDAIIAILASGVASHPEMIGIRLELARLYIELGNLPNAASILNSAPTTNQKDSARIARVRGDIHLRNGDMAGAAAAYRIYLAMFPSAPHASELRLFISRHHEVNR